MSEFYGTEETSAPEQSTETFAFQAEISQLMSLIINTFYSNKDIFLRELISNSSDALDKIRYQSLTDKSVLESDSNLNISIIPDKESSTLTIIDTGIGMTKQDMVNNLGTIAKSGTKAFMQALGNGADVSMIGQFGVGFYSSFLVANSVQVISKHNDDEQHIWESSASGSFTITRDITPAITLKRGTAIILHLMNDQLQYLEEPTIKDLIKTHSEFINYPISLQVQKEREVEIDEEVATEDAVTEDVTTEDVEDVTPEEVTTEEVDEVTTNEHAMEEVTNEVTMEEVDEDNEQEEPENKMRTEIYQEMEHLNKTKPVWTRKPSDISHDEYSNFYKSLSSDWDEHLAVKHFTAEGSVEFTTILYIPKRAPFDLFQKQRKSNIKLYVRRVFITDKCEEFIPEWLSFMTGLIDSEDLPLNISREILQKNKILQVIKKNIVKKSIELFSEIMEDDEKGQQFWEAFSKNIKLGITEDATNKEKLAKILKYRTNTSGETLTSLTDYITRMKENQKEIYYITGDNMNSIQNSSFLEGVASKGYEVLYMTEPIDEYVMQSLTEYDGKTFRCITKEGLVLPEDEGGEQQLKDLRADYSKTCELIKEHLNNRCENVTISNRLTESPCCIVTSSHGWSANMERIMKAQALGNDSSMQYMMGKKTLEINPNHPIIQELKTKLVIEEEKFMCINLINLLYETSLINSGFSLEDPSIFSKRLFNMVGYGLGVAPEQTNQEATESTTTDSTTTDSTTNDTATATTTESTTTTSNDADTTNEIVDEEMESVD